MPSSFKKFCNHSISRNKYPYIKFLLSCMRKTGTSTKRDHNHRSKMCQTTPQCFHLAEVVWQQLCKSKKSTLYSTTQAANVANPKLGTRPSHNKRETTCTPSLKPAHSAQRAESPTQASSHTHSLIEPSGQLEESPASPAVTNTKAMSYSLPNRLTHPVGLSWVQKQGTLSKFPLTNTQ